MKIIIVWVLFCFVHDSMALAPSLTVEQPDETGADESMNTADPSLDTQPVLDTGTQDGSDIMSNKPVFCEYFDGVEPFFNGLKCIPFLPPECIPDICEVLVYSDFTISNTSEITCDTDFLRRLTTVRPVILSLSRTMGYTDWSSILGSDNYEDDINALINFATDNKVHGYRIGGLSPQCFGDVLDVNIAENIAPYIKQLRNSGLVVGVLVEPYSSVIKNPCVTNCEALNDVVSFYEIHTFAMNDCNSTEFNGMTPVSFLPHGPGYMLSMEEVVNFLEASKCSKEKFYFDVEVYPFDNLGLRYYVSHSEVCTGYTSKDMCIPDTKQYFAKGYFIRQQGAGMFIKYINLDDIEDCCGCGPFVALRNALAGYNNQEVIPCANFDNNQDYDYIITNDDQ